MNISLGIFLALLTALFWGLGDYFIQKSSRQTGSWRSLLVNCALVTLVIGPFVFVQILLLNLSQVALLWFLGMVISLAAYLDFEALRVGKLAVVEPVYGLELPLTVMFSVGFGAEILSLPQIILIILVFVGLYFVAKRKSKGFLFFKRQKYERGIILALTSAIGMAATNFLSAYSSREISPLLVVWSMNFFVGIVSIFFVVKNSEQKYFLADLKRKSLVAQTFFSNAAWFTYVSATASIPIFLATAISNTYIAFGVLFGLIINKERLSNVQKIALVLVFLSVIVLALITKEV